MTDDLAPEPRLTVQDGQRECWGCGGRLSRYNPGNSCRACVIGDGERHGVTVCGGLSIHPLRRARRRRGLSLTTLAGLAGLSTSFLSRIETGERELRRKSHVLALAAALRVAPVELIPWVLSGNPAGRARARLPAALVVRTGTGSCATEATGDLLDCDCGCVTDGMKIQILDMWGAHGTHGRQRSRALGQGAGG